MSEYDKVNWEKAECRGTYPELFFRVEEERSREHYHYIHAVRSVCARCEIWEKCLNYAFRNERYGIWGGLTSTERLAYRLEKYAPQKRRALAELLQYGITSDQVEEVYEHSRHDRRVENEPTADGEDDIAGYR